MLYGVIIAGGSGKRLWPKSRIDKPKYLLKLDVKNSLLKETIARLRAIIPAQNIFIVTNKEHVKCIIKELPDFKKKNIIGEPLSKNTAPAICVAAALIYKKDPDGVIFVLPSDQIIEDKAAIKEIFSLASLIARMKDSILSIGIKPVFAATGYGYIKRGKLYKRLMAKKRYDVYKADKFSEKPSLKRAKAFLKSKRYYWNSGIFIAPANVFLNEFKKYQPRIYRTAKKISECIRNKKNIPLINRYYKEFPNISIDYAVMEKTKISYVIGADISWQDVGSWLALERYKIKEIKGNIIKANFVGVDVKDSIIIGEKKHLIAAIGLNNIVVIHTDDATLICPKKRAEDVKRIVEVLEKKGLKRYI